jgi:hypothetical protein
MKATLFLSIAAIILFVGCDMPSSHRDAIPPSSPRGLYTVTGDNLIEIRWIPNPEVDVVGYNVYVSSSYNGRYDLMGSTKATRFVDHSARNGVTFYYATTAYDHSGNESELSKDVVYDTPRPEGYNVVLRDYRTQPYYAGYDFSTYSVGLYNDDYTDIFFEYVAGSYYMNVWEDTDIQDMGYTNTLGEISYAPDAGWSPAKDARLITGHAYVVWTWDGHYAKLRVSSLSPNGVVFDWAYQIQKGNPRLKTGSGERRLEIGPGARERQGAVPK